jgi:hypothetical protein
MANRTRSLRARARDDDGSLHGTTVIDCSNAVDYTTFELKPSSGSAAELVAELAQGHTSSRRSTSSPAKAGWSRDPRISRLGPSRCAVTTCGA